jgi:hypothetical protein
MTGGKTTRRNGWIATLGLLGMVAAIVAMLPTTVASQTRLPDVDVVVVAEVYDSIGWLELHREVLGTPPESAKLLSLTLPAGTGGSRSLRVDKPKFSVEIITYAGRSLVKIAISGKVSAAEAFERLPDFEHAALEIQAGVVQNQLLMVYGLSTVTGHLLDVYLYRE